MKLTKYFQQGFSLVESLVAIGLFGGLTVLVLQVSKQAGEDESKLVLNQEINSITNQIRKALDNEKNCSATVVGKKTGDELTGINLSPQHELNGDNQASSDKKVFGPNSEIGKRILVKSVKLITKEIEGVKTRDYIRVTFSHLDSSDIVRDFMVEGEKNIDGTFKDCHSLQGQMVVEGVAQICKSMGGQWNDFEKKCFLGNLPNCFLTDENSCFTEGIDDRRKYVETGLKIDFSQYNYTSCETQFKLRKYEPKCRFTPYPVLTNQKCKCLDYGCTCLADERECASRWQIGCNLEFKIKKITKCCRIGSTP